MPYGSEKYDPRKAEHLLLIMPLNQPCPVQMERHFGVHRLHRSLFLERNWRLEHIFLRQIKLNPACGRRSEHVAFLSHGFSEELGHAIELGFDAI